MGTLKDTQIKALKPREKSYTVADGDGLALVVNPNNSKKWRFRYRFEGKAKTFSVGSYPEVGLADAREKLLELRKKVANGIDPSAEKKEKKIAIKRESIKNEKTFEVVAKEYLAKIEGAVSHHHHERFESLMRVHAYPFIGNTPIVEITHKDIRKLLVLLDDAGKKASAKKLLSALKNTFKYAVGRDYVDSNICLLVDISEVVTAYKPKEHAKFKTKKDLRRLLIAIDNYDGHISIKLGLKFGLLTALRASAIRFAEWEFVDFNNALMVIPRSTEGMKQQHNKSYDDDDFKLPLSKQALEVLREAKRFAGNSKYIFPSIKGGGTRPMSENGLNTALKIMGFTSDEIVFHGFRGTFATLANEYSDFDVNMIDVQLDHKVGNAISRVYNKAEYVEKRRDLVQWWADFCDEVAGNKHTLDFIDAEPDDEIYTDSQSGITVTTFTKPVKE